MAELQQKQADIGWDPYLRPVDREVFAAAGFGARLGFGKRPVLLVVDATYAFCGDRPEPILESVKRWRASSGEAAWAALDHIARLLAAARSAGVPVIFTAPEGGTNPLVRGLWSQANPRSVGESARDPRAYDVVEDVAPLPDELLISKPKPSAFFGTQLIGQLTLLGADSVVVCGGVTSGCIRATAVDAFSHNLRVAVVREATFDRCDASHWVSLLDIDQKYGDVVGTEDVEQFFTAQPAGARDGAPSAG